MKKFVVLFLSLAMIFTMMTALAEGKTYTAEEEAAAEKYNVTLIYSNVFNPKEWRTSLFQNRHMKTQGRTLIGLT